MAQTNSSKDTLLGPKSLQSNPTQESVDAAVAAAKNIIAGTGGIGITYSEAAMPPAFKDSIDKMMGNITEELQGSVGDWVGGIISGLLKSLLTIFLDGASVMSYVLGTARALDEAGVNVGREVVRPTILTLGELLERLRRDPALEEIITPYIEKLGFDETQMGFIKDLMHPLLSEGDMLSGWLRGLFNDDQTTANLQMHGRTSEQISTLKSLTEEYPNLRDTILLSWWGLIDDATFDQYARVHGWNKGIADMMRVAAQRLPAPVEALINARHGAFEQDKIDKWGLHNYLDPGFIEMMAHQGVTKETALNYWAGHWSPLPVTSAIKLFQRGHIDESTLNEIYHLQGLASGAWSLETLGNYHVPEYFVLSAIVESTPLDIETITNMVTAMGYEPQYIPIIAQAYHAKGNSKNNANLQKQLEKAFKEGTISASQAQESLANIGLSPAQVQAVMQNVEVEVQVETMDGALKLVRKDYVEKVINEEECVARMLQVGFTTAQINYWMAQWTVDRKLYVKRLSEAQVGKLYKYNVMSKADALAYWQALGYSSEDAILLGEYYLL